MLRALRIFVLLATHIANFLLIYCVLMGYTRYAIICLAGLAFGFAAYLYLAGRCAGREVDSDADL